MLNLRQCLFFYFGVFSLGHQTECVNSTSLSLCLCLHTEFSLCLFHSVYHHKWVDAQFFMVDAQFFRADAQFFRADAQFFAVGLL